MITITMGRTMCTGSGHAGAGAMGQDIVCAGVSALAYTLGEAVLQLEQDGLLASIPIVRLRSGEFEILCNPVADAREKAEYLFRTMGDGMQLMAQSFPEYVCIKRAGA